jgi:hypothetical protein
MRDGQRKGDDASHAVADDHRSLETQVGGEPGQIIREDLHRVGALRLVALPVPAEVDRDDGVPKAAEEVELGREIRVIAAPAVDQDHGRLRTFGPLVPETDTVSLERLHARRLSDRHQARPQT